MKIPHVAWSLYAGHLARNPAGCNEALRTIAEQRTSGHFTDTACMGLLPIPHKTRQSLTGPPERRKQHLSGVSSKQTPIFPLDLAARLLCHWPLRGWHV